MTLFLSTVASLLLIYGGSLGTDILLGRHTNVQAEDSDSTGGNASLLPLDETRPRVTPDLKGTPSTRS